LIERHGCSRRSDDDSDDDSGQHPVAAARVRSQ
jgi:hypothetical protein